MKLDEMLKLNNEVITNDILNEILESEECITFENNGCSGIYPNKVWYSITLKCDIADFEQEEINVYL